MNHLQVILDAIEDITLSHYPGSGVETPKAVEFLSSAGALRGDMIYLLTAQELPELLCREAFPASIFCVVCGDDPPPDVQAELPTAPTFVFVRGELLPLYTRLNHAMETLYARRRIDDIIQLCENMLYAPEQLLSAFTQMLDVGIFVLNGSYERVAGFFSDFDGNPYTEELERSGALSEESARAIRSGSPAVPAILYEGVSSKWSRMYLLLMWRDSAKVDPEYLCSRITEYVSNYRARTTPPDIPPFLVDPRLNRILEGKASEEETLNYFGSTPAWYAVLVLDGEPGVRWNAGAYQKQASLLRAAFRSANVTLVKSQVCAVVRMETKAVQDELYSARLFDERAFSKGWDRARLEQELQSGDVYLCCSTAFRSLRFLPTEFTLSRDALELAIRLDGCRGRRTVDYQNYSAFISVRYAVDRFLQTYEPRCIKALLLPEFVTLLFHDIENGTDLVKVLYRYYTYDDVNLTAQSLFVHRNTVYNKLRAIQKIINVDLDDFNFRRSCLASMQVYYYCEKCLGMNLREKE